MARLWLDVNHSRERYPLPSPMPPPPTVGNVLKLIKNPILHLKSAKRSIYGNKIFKKITQASTFV